MGPAQWRFFSLIGQNKGRPRYASHIAFAELVERTALAGSATERIAKPDKAEDDGTH